MTPGRVLDRLQSRIGRRGTFLLLVGILWVLQGVAIGTTVPSSTTAVGAYVLLHEQVPVPVRVGLWVASGLIGIIAAFALSPERDRWGYVAVVLMPLERAFSFLVGYVAHLAPGIDGYPPGLRAGTVWLAVAAAIMVVAGWPESRATELHRAE